MTNAEGILCTMHIYFSGWNALHLVCRYYQHNDLDELVRLLIVVGLVNVSVKTSTGFNALHLLCCYNCSNPKSLKNTMNLLLNEGIDVNAKTDNGFTALHFLCRNYFNPEILIEILLQQAITNNIINSVNYKLKKKKLFFSGQIH